ncbi:MBL fold metallo-hydrolase [Faecalibacillus intestinalis]|uniref:MBL fold metallo-hydrolase n=1 Tax=Faecalibacillus intestinalis TaxID=1982626 RepID=UPI00295F171C|nr:MBL fold metallo-hydrolase [Faecalibacillus intestinalis]
MSVIKSISVGNGDMFYIKHGSSNFTIIDCNMDDTNKKEITDEIIEESKEKDIIRFISTHPDEDHIHGLKYLDDQIGIANFYCVENQATKSDETEDFKRYCELRDSEKKAFHIYRECSRCWMNEDDKEKKYGSSGIFILWPIVDNQDYKEELSNAKDGKSPNNISPIIKYSLQDGVTVLWFGDLEEEFMEKIKDIIELPKADIIFAPHHGRSSGKIPKEWMEDIDPKIVVIGEAPSDKINYLSRYNTITQNTAGDIIFDCYTNNVDIYVSKKNYSVDFLKDKKKSDKLNGTYIGTLEL